MTTTIYFYYMQKKGLNGLCRELAREKGNPHLWDDLIADLAAETNRENEELRKAGKKRSPADPLPSVTRNGLTLKRLLANKDEVTRCLVDERLTADAPQSYFDRNKFYALRGETFLMQKYQLTYGKENEFTIQSLTHLPKNKDQNAPPLPSKVLGFYHVEPEYLDFRRRDKMETFIRAHSMHRGKIRDTVKFLNGDVQSLVRFYMMDPELIDPTLKKDPKSKVAPT